MDGSTASYGQAGSRVGGTNPDDRMPTFADIEALKAEMGETCA